MLPITPPSPYLFVKVETIICVKIDLGYSLFAALWHKQQAVDGRAIPCIPSLCTTRTNTLAKINPIVVIYSTVHLTLPPTHNRPSRPLFSCALLAMLLSDHAHPKQLQLWLTHVVCNSTNYALCVRWAPIQCVCLSHGRDVLLFSMYVRTWVLVRPSWCCAVGCGSLGC